MVWKDRDGKEVSAKEFVSRWKTGMANSTPLQQARISQFGNYLISCGIAVGLYVTFNVTWWIFIILCGSAFLNSVSLLSTWQRIRALKLLEEEIERQKEVIIEE